VSVEVSGIGRYKLLTLTFGCVYALPTVALCQPAKGSRNMLTKSTASSKLNRVAGKKGDNGNMRSNATIARLKMYNNGKAIRNKEGKVVGGQFMMADRAGDTKIDGSTGRIDGGLVILASWDRRSLINSVKR